MKGMIPQDILDQVREATDIVSLVGQYVPLKRAGQNYKALCPFHNEKTPSFTVSPARQTFKCFGCGEGGNVFTFVEKQEHCDFPEAVRMLAAQAGIDIPEATGKGVPREERSAIQELLARAGEFYSKALLSDAGEKAAKYLEGRKIGAQAIKRWSLGYAPPGWSTLLDRARKGGASLSMLEKAGLIIKANDADRHYDRFRDRLMFPITDPRGGMIGFGARSLDGSEPKYLNSPQTLLFDKSRSLYGLYQSKQAIAAKRQAVIVEGYTDVIMAHEHGVENVVATLGTALTRQHIDQLRRFADEAVLVFDSDMAGAKASDRSLEIFVERELPARIATLPAGEDPCDFCLNHGGEAFLERIEQAKSLFVYKIEVAAALNEASPRERAEAIDELLRLLAMVPGAVERSIQVDEVVRHGARLLKVEESMLRARFKEVNRGRPRSRGVDEPEVVLERKAAMSVVEEELVGLALSNDAAMARIDEAVEPEDFTDGRLRKIFERAREMFREEGRVEESKLVAAVGDVELGVLVVDLAGKIQQRGYQEDLEDCLARWEKELNRRKAKQVEEEMRQADQSGDESRLRELYRQYQDLIRQT